MHPMMTLDQIAGPVTVKVDRIQGGWELRQRLNQMGIHEGDTLALKQRSRFRGPVLVEIHGIQMALGRGMARHIAVKPL